MIKMTHLRHENWLLLIICLLVIDAFLAFLTSRGSRENSFICVAKSVLTPTHLTKTIFLGHDFQIFVSWDVEDDVRGFAYNKTAFHDVISDDNKGDRWLLLSLKFHVLFSIILAATAAVVSDKLNGKKISRGGIFILFLQNLLIF